MGTERLPGILQVVSFASLGGAEKYVYMLTREYARRGYPCHLVSPPGTFSDRFAGLRELGVTYEILDFRKEPLRSARRIRALIREHGISMVHSHLYLADFMVLLATFGLAGLARVSTLHMSIRNQGMVTRARRLQQRIFSMLAYAAFDKVFPVSESLRSESLGYFRLPRSKAVTCLNSIDGESMKPDLVERAAIAARYGIGPGRFKIGCVGSLHRLKSQITLIEALGSHLRDQPDLDAYIIGEGEFRPGLAEAIERLGLGGRVHLVGIQESMAEWYSLMDLFVHASFTEGLSTAVLEAMYMKLPVLVSDIPSNREIVSQGESGRFFPPGDAAALAEGIRALRADPGLAARLGERAHAFVAERCLIGVLADNLLANALPGAPATAAEGRGPFFHPKGHPT